MIFGKQLYWYQFSKRLNQSRESVCVCELGGLSVLLSWSGGNVV